MGLKLLEGRNFYPDVKADSGNVIINEELARMMGKQGQIGSLLRYGIFNYRIVGIVKNYLFNDMYASVKPLMLTHDREISQNYTTMIIRLKAGHPVTAALGKIETVIKNNNPGYPFNYQFVDEAFGSCSCWKHRLVTWQMCLQCWPFSFPAWDCLAWRRILQNAGQKR